LQSEITQIKTGWHFSKRRTTKLLTDKKKRGKIPPPQGQGGHAKTHKTKWWKKRAARANAPNKATYHDRVKGGGPHRKLLYAQKKVRVVEIIKKEASDKKNPIGLVSAPTNTKKKKEKKLPMRTREGWGGKGCRTLK